MGDAGRAQGNVITFISLRMVQSYLQMFQGHDDERHSNALKQGQSQAHATIYHVLSTSNVLLQNQRFRDKGRENKGNEREMWSFGLALFKIQMETQTL